MVYWKRNSFRYSIIPVVRHSLANTDAAFVLFKKRAQWRQIIFAGLERNRINIVPPERARKLRFESSDEISKNSSCLAICRIDLDLFARFGILQGNDADVGQRSFAFVLDLNCYEIVPPPAHREHAREIRRLKIRDEKYNRTASHNFVQIIECQSGLRAASLWFEKQNFSNDTQRVRTTLLRRNEKLDAVGEQ